MARLRNINKTGKGFTLVELMVVVAILSVLMSIVAPAVTGTKSQSTEGQVQSDGKATQTALDNFNNKSIQSGKFPEIDLDAAVSANQIYKDVLQVGATVPTVPGTNVTLKDKGGSSLGTLADKITKFGTSSQVFARTVINFDATTDVYDADGSVKKVAFVPDFLSKDPASIPLKGDETKDLGATNNTLEEYLWLALVNAPGSSQESRTIQVFRMTSASCSDGSCNSSSDIVSALTYTQVY